MAPPKDIGCREDLQADWDDLFFRAIQCFNMGDDFVTRLEKLSETPRKSRQPYKLEKASRKSDKRDM